MKKRKDKISVIETKFWKCTLTSDGGVDVMTLEVIRFPLVDGVEVIG